MRRGLVAVAGSAAAVEAPTKRPEGTAPPAVPLAKGVSIVKEHRCPPREKIPEVIEAVLLGMDATVFDGATLFDVGPVETKAAPMGRLRSPELQRPSPHEAPWKGAAAEPA